VDETNNPSTRSTTMDTVKTLEAGRTDATYEYVPFDMYDSKGREIGARLNRYTVRFVNAPDAMCYYRVPAGKYFAVQPHATRDRESYGPCQSSQYFATPEGRDLYIEKYLASAKKRAQKHNA
jgi:hypothetical protein